MVLEDEKEIRESMIQSISTEMFQSHDNDMIVALDETMRRAEEEEEEEKRIEPTTVFSTKDAKTSRRLSKSRSSKSIELGSSRGSYRMSNSSSSTRSQKEKLHYEGDGEEELEEKPPAAPIRALSNSSSSRKGSKTTHTEIDRVKVHVNMPPHEEKHSSRRKIRRKKSSIGERSVSRIRASKALVQSDNKTVAEVVKLLVERRYEATLLTDSNGILSGILTDKDVAFRVVAKGLDPNRTIVTDVMTPNPSCVTPVTSATVALKKMVLGQFRHLPVADNGSGKRVYLSYYDLFMYLL